MNPEPTTPLVILGQGEYARSYTPSPARAPGENAARASVGLGGARVLRNQTPAIGSNDTLPGAEVMSRPDRVFLWIVGAAFAWLVAGVAYWRLAQ